MKQYIVPGKRESSKGRKQQFVSCEELVGIKLRDADCRGANSECAASCVSILGSRVMCCCKYDWREVFGIVDPAMTGHTMMLRVQQGTLCCLYILGKWHCE